MNSRNSKVCFFQRRPRKGFSFSIEAIFQDVRNRLQNKIEASVKISRFYNNGLLTKLYNTIEAGLRQCKSINHITGEVQFLDLFMRRRTVVLTIHDCGVIHRKQGFSRTFVTLLYFTWPVNKARFVTSVSEETKREIINYTRCPADKIIVIPVAVNAIYQPHPKAFNEAKPVILQIGTGYNKNLPRLTEALRGIRCHLTIVGKLSAEQRAELEANGIEFSNEYNISNERMLEKYIECDILSFVSTFEGFGMPVVEANSVERVVLTSHLSSMPEIAGNAAHLVDPFDVAAIRQGIITLIENRHYREQLINNGRENKKRFDADRVANMYYELYRQMDDWD